MKKRFWKYVVAAGAFIALDAVAVVMVASKQGVIAGVLTPFMIAAWVVMQKYSPS